MRNNGKRERNAEDIGSKSRGKLKDDVDELFQLPLTEFIDARNTLSKRLKQGGRANDANLAKALVKPSISAWTVNQLYWKHRESFDRLLAAAQHFRQAQRSGLAGKVAKMRGSLDARSEALTHLSDLATSLLHAAGHNPTPDTMRRINTTLEAMSAHATLSDGPTPGRLSQDVEPPGFESLLSFTPDPGRMKEVAEPARVKAKQMLGTAGTNSHQKVTRARDVRQFEETLQARIAATKTILQAARKSLADARAIAHSFEAAQKKAYAEVKQAEKQVRETEQRFRKASAASEAAAQLSQSIAAEAEEATATLEDAKRAVENVSKELESMISELPAK